VDWDGQDDYVDSDADDADNDDNDDQGSGAEEESGSEEEEEEDEEEDGSEGEDRYACFFLFCVQCDICADTISAPWQSILVNTNTSPLICSPIHSAAFSDEEEEEEEEEHDIAAAVGDSTSNTNTKASAGRAKRPRADLGLLGKGLVAALQASRETGKRQRTDTAHGAQTAANSSGGSTKPTKSAQNKTQSSLPDNFSRVDTDLPDDELRAQFPLFADLKARGGVVDVVLKAGQMLYIPAGWFHEVRSRGAVESCVDGSVDGSVGGSGDQSEYGGHLALNYWFHPPDGASFEAPYTSDFWRKDFEDRMKK